MKLVDVHTHLTHQKFNEDLRQVITRAEEAGLEAVVVNGLEPSSNRRILEMAQEYPIVQPAAGIYPIEGVLDLQPEDKRFGAKPFCVDTEVKFIESLAKSKQIIAIGECGLDAYHADASTFEKQEDTLEKLADIAIRYDIPLIVHSRKREQRTIELLAGLGVMRVDFHCFCGRSKWAKKAAEKIHD